MKLEKYTAGGNDFLITHEAAQDVSKLAKEICNRHFGVGADGLVLVKRHAQYAYEWEFYNSDGSRALMCGNASMCVALYAVRNSLASETHSFYNGSREIFVQVGGESAKSNLGKHGEIKRVLESGYLIDTGVRHVVLFEHADIERARELRAKFDANVNFAQVDGKTLRVSTFERGVEDYTLACGTGMAAVAAVAREILKMGDFLDIYPRSNCHYKVEIKDGEVILSTNVKFIAKIELGAF